MNNRLSWCLLACIFMLGTTNLKAQIFINEFLASNANGITDEAGDNEDWIEIYNAGASAVNLAGYYISDDIADPLIWQISSANAGQTTVPAGGYLILWADKDTDDGANHIDIKLGSGGEDIILTAPNGTSVIDQLTFGPQSDDVSYGRTSDGASGFQFFSVPTPNSENVTNGNGSTYTVTLNIPIATANDDGEQLPGGGLTLASSDIELGQDGGSSIIAGLRFTNVSLPPTATINNAYLQFFADEVQVGSSNLSIRGENSGNAAPFSTTASNLFSSKPTTPTTVNWTPAPWPIIGVAGADQQTPDLTAIVSEIIAHPNWNEGNAMTFIINGTGTRTGYAFDSNPNRVARLVIEAEIPLPTDPIPTVYINEVVASASTHTDDSGKREDWIEIYNPNNQDVNLGGLYLTDKFSNLDQWQISPGTIVPANGYLVFFADKDTEEGPLHADFSLKGGGEEVALVQLLADGLTIIDSLSYEDMPFLASYGRVTDGSSALTFFGEITPEASNNGADLFMPSPSFSVPSGSYASSQSVTINSAISGASIYYTTDGSLPDVNSTFYNGSPINVNSTSSIRAIATRAGYTNSQPSDVTYLINQSANVPILYITTDPDNFFDDEIGIYVDGTNGVVAYCATQPVNWARDWERPINLKMFLPDGELAFDVNAGVEISGACSRNQAQKSLAINLRDKEFGDDAIEYPLFPQRDHEDYQRLKLRTSGQDMIRLGFRDMLNQQMIFGKLDIDLQAGRPSLLYINGEFWGTYNIREKYAGEYFEAIYGVDEDDLDIIKSPGLPWKDVKKGSDATYNALYDVVESSNMQNNNDWNYFESQVDVNEMMNYWITMTYMANYDWPANNLTVWRERKDGEKWRYGIADTDGSTQNMLTPDAEPSFNNFAHVNDPNSQSWPNHSSSTLFLRKALDRQAFREEYIQRACSIMELVYNEDRVNGFTDDMVALWQPNVDAQLDRWGFDNALGGSVFSWNQWVNLYRDFYERRGDFYRQHMNDFYGLDGFYNLTFNYNANTGGDVFVNTNEMDVPYNYQAAYFRNVPLRVKAVAKPGYAFQFWLETGNTNPEIDFVSGSNATLTPIFELVDCDNSLIGTACNDNDACTTGDVYDADCNCVGTFQDSDNDGVCDADDQCPGFNDNLDTNNNGIPDDCENCTDNDNDGFCADVDCNDNNPNVPATIGSPCNDGNNCTTNDVYVTDCNCAGTFADSDNDGVCDADDQCPGFDDNLDTNNNGIPDDCENCTDNDNDGFCADVDCNDNNPAIPTAPGTPCNDGNSDTSNDVIQSDGCTCQGEIVPPTGEYCNAQGDQPWLEWIAGVQLSELNNSSGKSQYSNFTSQFATVNAGETYDITLTTGYSWETFDEYFRVWIDYNQDNVFNANELAYAGILSGIPNGTDFASLNGSINVPGDALAGTTRMRVAMQRGAYATPCGSFLLGEVEDYSVVINAGTGANLTLSNCPSNINVVANIGANSATASWTAPTASSTCVPNTTNLNQTSGPASGSSFAVNTSTTITYTATDLCGNQKTCSFVVSVSAPSNGSISLSCPGDISATAGAGQGGANVSWNTATGSTTCPNQGLNISQTGGQPNGSFFSVGSYQILYTATDACGNQETCTFTVIVHPDNTGGDYCQSTSNFPWHEWISNVQLNTINNPSGKLPYSDFTSVSTNLTPGTNYNVNLTASYSYTTYNEHWKVWIDYNQNGTFEEPGELAFSGVQSAPPDGTPNAVLNGNFTVPANASPGSTRMRVSMKRGANADPCESLPFGEVEDYTIFIGGNAPQGFVRPSLEDIALYPSPTISKLTILLGPDTKIQNLEVINLSGQTIYRAEGDSDQNVYEVNVSDWLASMYFVRFQLEDGRMLTKRFVVQRD